MEISVLEWLENTASKLPEKIAFSDSQNSITFAQVLQAAKKVGSALADVGVGREPVAVITGRHVYTPAAYLGVVYGDCFYAPIDGHLPPARVNQMLQTMQPRIILTDRENVEYVRQLTFAGQIYVLEEILAATCVEQTALDKIRNGAGENDPLYIIFTSGSTGNPKGVLTSHHSLMCYIADYTEVLGIGQDDVLGNQSPLDYIAAIRDIYLPLYTGCSMVIIPKELFMTPACLFDFLNEHKITAVGWSVTALTVPASLGAFEYAVPQYLKKICFSGSVMPCRYLKIWQEKMPDTLFVNQYGPTEATASCTYYVVKEKVDDDTILPIGIPYKNYRVFLVNEDGTATPNGQEGEICISGSILALGYYNDPLRTAAAFVQNPFNDSYQERIYKTGDIGMLRPDGILEFHGRKDRQIKHMGHRIELDEIDIAAAKIQGVAECCSVYNQQRETLWLFYTGSVSVRDVVLALRTVLPGFMVPRKVTCLTAMPKLPNGKINIRSLKQLAESK